MSKFASFKLAVLNMTALKSYLGKYNLVVIIFISIKLLKPILFKQEKYVFFVSEMNMQQIVARLGLCSIIR